MIRDKMAEAVKWCWFLIAMLLLGASPGGAEEIERFNRVEIWRLHVMWRCTHNDSQVRDHPASDNIEERIQKGDLNGSVDFKLVKSRDSGAKIYQWRTLEEEKPTGQIAFTAENATRTKNKRSGKESWFRMAASASGIEDGGARLTIDARAKTFRMGGYASSAEGQYEQSSSMGPSARSTMGINLSTGSDNWEGDLPASGMTITGGTRQVTCNAPIVLAGRPVDVSWTLEPWKEEDLPEIWVEPQEGFDNWVPVGNLKDPEQPGNTITVKAEVREPESSKGKRSKSKARIQFSLPKVSREPGVCMNWPPGSSVKIGDGLRILEEENRGTLEVKASVYAQTLGLVDQTQVVLSVFDYGAWGRLKVTAQDDQGNELTVRVRGKEGSELSIPVDDNDNHIADAWEKDKGVSEKPADADDETGPTEDNKHDGDGLTLFEEYRGFAVKGQHFSGNPQRKDLFICDHTDAKVAGPGIKLFEKASQINVHEVDYKELGSSSRIINANHAQAPHAVDQHGLLIEDGPEGGDPQQVPVSNNAPFGSPKQTLYIQLPGGKNYASGDSLADVAHEIGHAVGLHHHGENALRKALWVWRSDSDGHWQMYEQAFDTEASPLKEVGTASPIEVYYEPKEGESTLRRLKHEDGLPLTGGFSWSKKRQGWLVQVYTQGGQWSGDVECFMRYQDKQAFFLTPDDGKRYIVDHSQDRTRIKFCTSQEVNFTNLETHNPFSRGGKTQLGNCISQIMINDAE